MKRLIQGGVRGRIFKVGEPIAYGGQADPFLRIVSHMIETNGLEATITFNEPVTIVGPAHTAFWYIVDGNTINGVTSSLVGNVLTINLDEQIDETVTVKGSYNNLNASVTGDNTGTTLASFSDATVRNDSTVSPTAQVYQVADGVGGWENATDGALDALYVST